MGYKYFYRFREMKTLLYILIVFLPVLVSAQEKKELGAQIIYVSFDKTKHIVLPAQVSNVFFGREDYIKAERVENVPNIVRVTAQEEDFIGVTNLVIVCTNGNVYSYDVRYLPKGLNDPGNVVYAGDTNKSHSYSVVVNNSNTTEMFFPADIVYCRQGNEEVIGVEYYNNMVTVGTTFDQFNPTNLFVVDQELNTYEITLIHKNANETYSYNFDDGRKYIAHVDVNSIDMDNLIGKLHYKKRNIFSVGVIKNKFEMSLANLYVFQDYMFFVFDIKNFSNIDYDVDFVKCFLRDLKKSKNAIEQEVQYDPVEQKDFDTKILGKSENRFVLAFRKFTIPDNKVFEIEMFEKGGGRHMKLSVLNEYILSAELLK